MHSLPLRLEVCSPILAIVVLKRSNYSLLLKFLGVVPEASSIELSKSPNSSSVETLKSQSSKDVGGKKSPWMSSKDSFVGTKSMALEGKGKQSNKEADLWWLNLPYVLVSWKTKNFANYTYFLLDGMI